MRVAIVGCGSVGQKRARALAGATLTLACDVDLSRAQTLGVPVTADWRTAVRAPDVDLVVVSTPTDLLVPVARAAVEADKHVLIEKPVAVDTYALQVLLDAERLHPAVRIRVGFNHRYHPAAMQMRWLLDSGVLGVPLCLRANYGHGGRVGYENEWRAKPGGGELLDQGVHLIDLARWFLGDLPVVQGALATYFWDMPVDDNAFLLCRTALGQIAWLHASCTEWKNTFNLEIYGKAGKLHWQGLGGSYGVERLTHYAMRPEMGPPDTQSWEYPRGDSSWELEMAEFLVDIRLGRPPEPGLQDALEVLRVVERLREGL